MTTTTRAMTADELLCLPDDGMRHELIDGVLITMPLNFADHGFVASNLTVALSTFVRQRNLGRVLGNLGCILGRDPDTVLGPDIAVIATDRLPLWDEWDTYFPGAPDLVAEILSPPGTAEDIPRKIRLYLDAGVRLIWTVDTETCTVAVHAPGQPVRTLREGEILDGEDVLPGFEIRVADIFV